MYTIFAQPKFAMASPDGKPVGYELFVRRGDNSQWQQPLPFAGISVWTLNHLLRQTIACMPANIELLSFNLEQSQFIDPTYAAMIASVQAETDITLYTELTERLDPGVTSTALLAAAKRFFALGLAVCIDDVGTGENSPALVMLLNDYITEYKFAFQNFRQAKTAGTLDPQLRFWTAMAQRHHKLLAWEGIENNVESALLAARYPGNLLQGYLFGRQSRLEAVAYTPAV